MAARFDIDALEIRGAPVPLADSVAAGRANFPDTLLAIGRDGTMAYANALNVSTTIVWVSRDGAVTPVLDASFHSVRLSPDDSRFAADDPAADRVWIHDLIRGTRILVVETPNPEIPRWSPDGTEIAYGSGDGNIYVKSSDGSGEARLLLERDDTQWPLSWSPDGRFLALAEISDRGSDLWLLSRDGELIPFADSRARENAAAFSPDGKWIAYQSDETGRPEIYVRPFPGPGSRVPISANGGTAPVWSGDGRELVYREGTAMMAVAVSPEPTFSPGRPTLLFDGPYQADGTGHPSYDVSSDGQRFLMMRREGAQLTQLHVVLNLGDELTARDRQRP